MAEGEVEFGRVHHVEDYHLVLLVAEVLDAGEDIEVVPMPIDQVLRLQHSGQITHALVSVALSRFELYRAGSLSLDISTRRNAAMLGEKPVRVFMTIRVEFNLK